MIGSDDDLQFFVDLGLTLLQAKVYISLVGSGKANVKTISHFTQVSRPDIYRTIKTLQEKGLIEQEIAKPVTFRAVPIKSAIEFLMNRMKIKYDELEKRGELVIEKFNSNDNDSFQEEAKIILVPSQDALIKKIIKAIDNVKDSIYVATSFNRFNKACYILSANFENAWNRKVKGRALIEVTEEKQIQHIKQCWKSPTAEIKYTRSLPETVMEIYDSKEVFIFTNPSKGFQDSPALWTDNPGIVAMTKNYFETLWLKAMKNPQQNLGNNKTTT